NFFNIGFIVYAKDQLVLNLTGIIELDFGLAEEFFIDAFGEGTAGDLVQVFVQEDIFHIIDISAFLIKFIEKEIAIHIASVIIVNNVGSDNLPPRQISQVLNLRKSGKDEQQEGCKGKDFF